MTDVTLLLTIYNRRDFTLRWIDFIQKFNCPFNIYICDGGNDEFLKRKLINISKKNNKIKYRKFKYYKNFKNFHEKFYQSTKEIKTKYTYLCEDDDFVIFENINRSKKFLDKNKDYTCSGGQSYNIELIENNFILARQEHNKNLSFKDKSKFKRVCKVINKMQSNYNCLHRTKNLNRTFKLINKINFNNIYESELLFVLSSFYFGKINRFNHIEYIKIDNNKFSSSNNFLETNSYIDLISSKNFSEENYAFLNIFKGYFKNSELKKVENYLNNFLRNTNKYRINQLYPNTKTKIKYFLKYILKFLLIKTHLFWGIKKFYIKFKYIKTGDLNLFNKTSKVSILSKKNLTFFRDLFTFLEKY